MQLECDSQVMSPTQQATNSSSFADQQNVTGGSVAVEQITAIRMRAVFINNETDQDWDSNMDPEGSLTRPCPFTPRRFITTTQPDSPPRVIELRREVSDLRATKPRLAVQLQMNAQQTVYAI